MEHRRKYRYKGYEVAIFISHSGDLTVDVNKDGELVDGCFGNQGQAEAYIDNLDFETNGILITGGSSYGTTNIRVTPEAFKTIIEDCYEAILIDAGIDLDIEWELDYE